MINTVHWMFNVILSRVNVHVKKTLWDNDVIYVKRINIEMDSNVQVRLIESRPDFIDNDDDQHFFSNLHFRLSRLLS